MEDADEILQQLANTPIAKTDDELRWFVDFTLQDRAKYKAKIQEALYTAETPPEQYTFGRGLVFVKGYQCAIEALRYHIENL